MKLRLLLLASMLISILLTSTIYADTLTLQPGSSDGYDSFIGWSGSTPSTTGIHGSDPYILVENRSWAKNYAQGLLRFDMPEILEGATITDATLGLYLFNTYKEYSNTEININRVTSSWDESTVQWPDTPSYDSTPLLSFTPLDRVGSSIAMGDTPPYWVELDITDVFTKWLNNEWDNYGMLLEVAGTGTTALFYSSDTSNAAFRPKVEIDYSTVTATPIPGAIYLLGSGLFGLIGLRKKFSGR
ncbi:MAG: DNRLRE domain-containing protein [Deltaproteobacteria bacterium]|nr:DNRLRE domain-containing protein [Deltaproteobacteria bacterium]